MRGIVSGCLEVLRELGQEVVVDEEGANPVEWSAIPAVSGDRQRSAACQAMPGDIWRRQMALKAAGPLRHVVYLISLIRDILAMEGVEMAKTLIDIDEEYLAAAQQALNTVTKKDTVNAALRAVAAMAARRRDLQRLVSGGLPDLGDAEVMMSAAWQR